MSAALKLGRALVHEALGVLVGVEQLVGQAGELL